MMIHSYSHMPALFFHYFPEVNGLYPGPECNYSLYNLRFILTTNDPLEWVSMYGIDLFEKGHGKVIVLEATVQVDISAITHDIEAPER